VFKYYNRYIAMLLNNKCPLIILDFDGVILESVEVKTEAFRRLFSFAPGHVEEIVNFHRENGGMSRFEKFRYFYRNVLKEPLSDEQYEYLCNRFSELVLDGVLNSPFVPGSIDFLQYFSARTSLFLVSATPFTELDKILTQRDLHHYFKAIYGSPRPKQECIAEILSDTVCPEDDAIFVGDALNDYKAAKTAGVRFIGRVRSGSTNVFIEKKDVEIVVSDLEELRSYLEGLYC